MIQNPSVAGSGGAGAEIVPVVFSGSGPNPPIQIIYTTVENGNVVYKDETRRGSVGTIYALKGSVLYCTVDSVYTVLLNITSGGTTVASGTYQGLHARNYDFKVYQVTG